MIVVRSVTCGCNVPFGFEHMHRDIVSRPCSYTPAFAYAETRFELRMCVLCDVTEKA